MKIHKQTHCCTTIGLQKGLMATEPKHELWCSFHLLRSYQHPLHRALYLHLGLAAAWSVLHWYPALCSAHLKPSSKAIPISICLLVLGHASLHSRTCTASQCRINIESPQEMDSHTVGAWGRSLWGRISSIKELAVVTMGHLPGHRNSFFLQKQMTQYYSYHFQHDFHAAYSRRADSALSWSPRTQSTLVNTLYWVNTTRLIWARKEQSSKILVPLLEKANSPGPEHTWVTSSIVNLEFCTRCWSRSPDNSLGLHPTYGI